MLNLDLLGAIAFDKGCYTGQEVIARAHYRGRVKRRLQRWHATARHSASSPGDSARSRRWARAHRGARRARRRMAARNCWRWELSPARVAPEATAATRDRDALTVERPAAAALFVARIGVTDDAN